MAGAPPARKHEVLDGLLQESIHAWSKAGSGDWVVALSGGFDSRYGLALLDREGVRPRCLTFGNPGSYDVTGARRVARRLGLEHGVYRVKQGSWPAWRRSVQRLGVIGGFQYVTGWADDWLGSLRARGSRVILGFLGDALSGKHLVERDAADWIGNWARWSLDDGRDVNWVESDLLAPAVRRRMRELMTERFEALCRPQTFAFPHQKALHLDLFGRQRRAAASQANLIADHLAPVPFFYTRALIEFWSSLGYEDLRGQALYRSFALERYPRIFEPERRPGVPARLWGAARNLVVGALPQTKNLLAPGEIDTRAQLALHKAGVRALVESAAPAIAGWLDVSSLLRQIDRFPAAGGINALQLQRLANLLMLLELGGDRRAGATAAGGAQAANLP